MPDAPLPSEAIPEPTVAGIVADILGIDGADVDPVRPLTSLGLESFTAVRLRRRLRDETGLDLPLTAFLGGATVASVAQGRHDPDGAADPAPPAGPTEDAAAPAPASPAGGAAPASAPGAAPAADGADFPLTPLQAAYWIGRDPAFPLGGVATFYYREYDRRPEGDPEADLARLTTAWNRLVDHHPMLRMVIGRDGRQRVLPTVPPYRIGVTDLRAADPAAAERALDELRHSRSHQVRPTDRWPLFDLNAVLLPDGRTRVQLGVDVLALDLAGWMQVLAEWGALVADPGAEPPRSPLTFPELVRRRRADPAEEEARRRDLAYWAERAETLPPGPALPWTRDLAEVRSHRFVRDAHRLDAATWSALRARAADHGLSPTGLLLAAFALVLARWGATAPFSLNTTLFDRPDDPALRHLVGDFTSTVLVEVPEARPAAWDGFLAFATAVNRRFWTDLDHRSVSGVEALRSADGPRLTPAHPVVFTSGIGLHDPDASPVAWLGEEVFGVSQTPQVALDHIVHEEGGELVVSWDGVEGTLPPGFAAGMAAAHARLLRRLAADPAVWTDPALGWDPSFRPDEPLDRTPFPEAGPLLDGPWRAAADRHGGLPALLGSGGAVSHGELAERAARTGAALAAAGLGPGDLVAVGVDKGPDQVAAILGVSASGAGYVPVEPSWPAERVASVCAQAGVAHALITGGPSPDWPEGVAVHRIAPDGGLVGGPEPDGAAPRRPAPDDLAYAIFTSGSTGRPKGVAIEHRQARTTIDDLVDRFPLRPDDRMLALSAFSFDLSVHDVYGVMGAGAALVLPDAHRQRDPGHWLELMGRHRVTLWNTAPALMEMLVEYAEIDPEAARGALADLRLVFLSADWIPVTLPDRVRALAPKAEIVSLGGATEGSIWSICHPIGDVDPDWPSIPYGRALRGQSFHILDAPGGGPVPAGVPGELHIGGAGLARGYIGDPAQTAERFLDHPVLGRVYHTGDLGRWRPDGTIEFLGRADRQVKIRGHRIELGEVESALDRVPGVRQAVAMSMRGPDDRPRLVAFLVGSEHTPLPGDPDLVDLLRTRVPDYMVPSRFVRLPELPVTDNGKIDYKALANPYRRAAGPAAGAPDAPAAAPGAVSAPADAPLAAPQVTAAPAATGPAPGAAPDGLDAALGAALRAGLTVRLSVGAGDLPADRALAAAGALVRALADADSPVRAHARLDGPALVDVDLSASGTPSAEPATISEAAPEAAPEAAASPAAPAAPAAPAPPAAPSRAPTADPGVAAAVTRVFTDLLSTEVDPETPFFRMGATSLTLVLAHGRLAAELAPDLSVVDLFANPTVRALAAHITGRRTAAPPAAPATAAAPPPAAAAEPTDSTDPAVPAPPSRGDLRRRARDAATEVAP
ncbi:non-ribosomal peptide synthetase [Nocardiopsis trehalosi]|uniref:non-ribosomal peptide synthetase n=1 Tax=Nocardiopsis trehalosi TaxID=109329 RepID=UPI00082C8DEE|nr:non-ribosomal peptide synthetase [Nocardiopsis trehalosi]